MSFPIYDFRSDIRHLLVTPQIRSRFMRMEPGEGRAQSHSHDLGHEVFLVLQGRALFNINGEEQELGPGQLCIALADQSHQVRAVGDEPMIMYLSVTPHVQPTHTGRTEDGGRLPIRFAPSSAYEVETDTEIPVEDLIDHCVEAAARLAETAGKSAKAHREAATRLEQAVSAGDEVRAGEIRGALWEGIRATFEQVYSLGEVWNELVPRTGRT